REVVVDRLRNADDREPLLVERIRDLEGTVSPDRDQCVDSQLSESGYDLIRAVRDTPGAVGPSYLESERIAARCRTENRSAEMGDSSDGLGGEGKNSRLTIDLSLQDSRVPTPDPENLPPHRSAREGRRADHR